MTTRLTRLIDFARLLTGRDADTLDPGLLADLRRHLDRRDWDEADIVTTLERLPARLRRLLRCLLRDDCDEGR